MFAVNVSSYSPFSTVYLHSGQTYSFARILTSPVFGSLGLPIIAFPHFGHFSLNTQHITCPLSTALRVKYTHSSVDSGCLSAIVFKIAIDFLKLANV